MDNEYLTIIGSDRVSARTRDVLISRITATPRRSNRMSLASFSILESVIDRLIPQSGIDRIDVCGTLAAMAFESYGDGWRFADMPPDEVALIAGLGLLDASSQRIHGQSFALLAPSKQDALLGEVQTGDIAWREFDARHWFEDLLAMATEIYVSHPAILARIGFSGIAFRPAWQDVGLNTAQAWEPKSK